MSSSLAEKMRKAREQQIEIEGHKYTIRRPTEAERVQWLRGEGITALDLVRRCVVGWDLQEVELIAGGSPVAAEFSDEAFAEYVNDRPDIWEPLSKAISAAIEARVGALEAAKKN